jgi:SAM-dependent methyltransferase
MKGKNEKLNKIRYIIRYDMPFTQSGMNYNFLSDELRKKYKIVNTDNVSSNNYDPIALSIIEQHSNGIILDCGSGKRSVYYENVVNFEIAPYDTTDVLGVGEELPFKDPSFDAVFSLAVLEHVKDPFKCAKEISRVMKPGATLYCVVPFLQPLHGYPHHYYNMSMQGLKNLFEDHLQIEKQEVIASGLPIFTLTWILQSWLQGLEGDTKEEFLKMSVADLVGDPISYLDKNFVTHLSNEKNFELASTTVLMGKKLGNSNYKATENEAGNSPIGHNSAVSSLLKRLLSSFKK